MQAFFQFIWTQIVNYFKAELADKVKAAFFKGLEAFKEAVWKELKDEIHDSLEAAIAYVESYFGSEEAKVKEAMLVDTIMDRIHLPLIAKPFKGLIKKMIKDKIEELAQAAIAGAKLKLNA